MQTIYHILAVVVLFVATEIGTLVFFKRRATYRDRVIIVGILFLATIALAFSQPVYDTISLQYQTYALNKTFKCPEEQTELESNTYLYSYVLFYKQHYPTMTLQAFLEHRYKLLQEHNCTQTLANIAQNNASVKAATSNPTLEQVFQSSNPGAFVPANYTEATPSGSK